MDVNVPGPISTTDLVQQAQQGSTAAFEALVQELGERLWRSALVMCQDEGAARDLVQETWLEAWKCLRRFDGRCQFSTWLHGILRHRYLKLVRRNSRKPLTLMPTPSDAHEPDPGPLPGATLEAQETRMAIKELLRTLPDEQRQVLELRFFANAALADIAIALDCPEGTVKSRIHHALKKLRKNPNCLNLLAKRGESGV